MSVKIYTNKKTCHNTQGITDEFIIKSMWYTL